MEYKYQPKTKKPNLIELDNYSLHDNKQLEQLKNLYNLASDLADSWQNDDNLRNFDKAVSSLDTFICEYENALEKEQQRQKEFSKLSKFEKDLCTKYGLALDDPKRDIGFYLNQKWCSIDAFAAIADSCGNNYKSFVQSTLEYLGVESLEDDKLQKGCYINGRWLSPSRVLTVASSSMPRLEIQRENVEQKKKETPPTVR